MSKISPTVPLEQLCDPDRGITYGIVKVGDFIPGGVPVIRGGDIRDGRIVFDDHKRVTEKVSNKFRRTILRGGELLINLIAEPGHVAIVPKNLVGSNVSRDVAVIALNDSVDHRFVCYLLKSPDCVQWLTSRLQGSVTQKINLNTLRKVPVPLFPLCQQKAIAHILGTLDDKIELNREMNQTLEAMARAIFKSWFVDFDPVRAKMEGRQPAGMDAATAEFFPDEFEESALGMIPKGWRVGTIDNCTSLILDYRGKTPKKLQGDWSLSGIPAISAKNIKTGRLVQRDSIRYVDPQLFKRWMKDTLSIGDIIMTSEAPLGELFYLASNSNYCLSQRLFGIRADDINCKSIYLYHALASEEVQAQIQSRATGTTVLGIRQTELRKVQILLPLIDIQKKASVHLENYIRQVHLNEGENETLASIRDTLLPKLLSGEIRIKEAEQLIEKVA